MYLCTVRYKSLATYAHGSTVQVEMKYVYNKEWFIPIVRDNSFLLTLYFCNVLMNSAGSNPGSVTILWPVWMLVKETTTIPKMWNMGSRPIVLGW